MDIPAYQPSEDLSSIDVLERVAGAVSIHLYEMQQQPDGTYSCTAFMGAALDVLLGPLPVDVSPEDAWDRAVHPDDRPAYETAYARLAEGATVEVEYRLIGYDGVTRWVWDRMRPRRGPDGRLQVDGVVVDVTSRRRTADELAAVQRQLEHSAYHDPLTDLPNRTYFREHLERSLARARRDNGSVAVLFVDLDDFKLVNDSFGHAAGDELLVEVATRLNAQTRASDFVARQGGDEFLIVVEVPPGHTTTDKLHAPRAAEHVAERIRASLVPPFTVGGVETHVRASMGISLFPDDADDAETLLRHADVAMYRAKRLGRDSYRLYTAEEETSLTQLTSVAQLRAAVERADDLFLEYQPIVRLETGEIVSAEALVRWRDAAGVVMQPADFIPLVERTGLIVPLSEWVLEEACRQLAEWRSHGLELGVSINLPPAYWRPPAVGAVLSALERHRLSPHHLTVELTERTTMIDVGRSRLLLQLRNHGVGVAMDDFGTGHSSLERLAAIRANQIKLDRSFVRTIPDDLRMSRLVNSMIELAHSLGAVVVAEGVETADQARYLIGRSCELAQGFLFGRPVAPEEIETLMRSGERVRLPQPQTAQGSAA